MKRTLTLLLALIMVFGLLAPAAVAVESETDISLQSLPFTDVSSGAWYFPYIQFVHTNGIMQGTSATAFSPASSFSRAQVLTTLFRIHNDRRANDSDPTNNNFTDVRADVWYAPMLRGRRTMASP